MWTRSLQEAQKRMKIKKSPRILVIHLKRFKYMEQLNRHKKLSYRVVFPLELKLSGTLDDTDSEYSLFAVVVHVGPGPNHGHYVSLVKSHNHWLFFDDENVEMIDESVIQTFFGSAQEYSNNTDHGYILFYESLAADDNWNTSYSNLGTLLLCPRFVVQDFPIISSIAAKLGLCTVWNNQAPHMIRIEINYVSWSGYLVPTVMYLG